jgi:hypothetical protein
MLTLYGRGNNFVIRNSMFDIRYSSREHGKFIILELPTAEELAKHMRRIQRPSANDFLCQDDDAEKNKK